MKISIPKGSLLSLVFPYRFVKVPHKRGTNREADYRGGKKNWFQYIHKQLCSCRKGVSKIVNVCVYEIFWYVQRGYLFLNFKIFVSQCQKLRRGLPLVLVKLCPPQESGNETRILPKSGSVRKASYQKNSHRNKKIVTVIIGIFSKAIETIEHLSLRWLSISTIMTSILWLCMYIPCLPWFSGDSLGNEMIEFLI